MKTTIQVLSTVENLGRLMEFLPGAKLSASAEEDYSYIKISYGTERNIIILDLRCAVGNGMNFLQNLKLSDCSLTVIVLTNLNNDDFRNRCIKLGADYFFDKEKEIKELSNVLNKQFGSLIKMEIESAELI